MKGLGFSSLAAIVVAAIFSGLTAYAVEAFDSRRAVSFSISGIITDERTNKPIAGATVETRNSQSGGSNCHWRNTATTTDEQGKYRLDVTLPRGEGCSVNPGAWVSAEGYRDSGANLVRPRGRWSGQELTVGPTTEFRQHDLSLQPEPNRTTEFLSSLVVVVFWILLIGGLGAAYVALAVQVARAAVNKGRNFAPWFWIALVFGLILPAIVLAVLKDERYPAFTGSPHVAWGESTTPQTLENDQYRACPMCAEPIRVEAIKCKHCQSMLEE